MKNLVYKEMKLLIFPVSFTFLVLTALLLVPAWPYSLAFLYAFFNVQMIIALAVTYKDAEFTAILPVKKSDYVKSKAFSVVFLQVAQIVAAIPFALITSLLVNRTGNPLSLDANFTLFAVALLGFAAFNTLFLPLFFKTAYKAGIPLVLGVLANVLVVVVCELLCALIPVLKANLDSLATSTIGWRLLALAFGTGIYVGATIFALKKSIKNYEKVNL